MTKINNLQQPKPVPTGLDSVERFQWWKRHFMAFNAFYITSMIAPIYMFRRGNLEWGIKLMIIFYFLSIIGRRITIKITKDADNKFLKEMGKYKESKKKWWKTLITILFILLQIYIIYIMITIWRLF